MHGGSGIALVGSNRNTIRYNRHDNNSNAAIVLASSNANEILCNDSSNDGLAAHVGPGSVGNTFWRNNSFGPQTARDAMAANAFQLPPPTGGNYWKAHAPACVDANGDRFCDVPFAFVGNQDALPHVRPIPWLVEPMFCASAGEPQKQRPPVKPGIPGASAERR
jgi:parallel beta-helix repeat protein